jgi:hypothetical protein
MLKLNLQFFGEDDLDLDSMLEEFEAEWESEVEEADEVEEEVETEADDLETETAEEDEPTPEAPPLTDDEDKRHRAFAELRRERDEAKKYAEFVQRLASDSGMSPEDILSRYEERQLEAKSKETGVPVEFLKRQTETESRLGELESQLVAERMDKQIQSVISSYGATNEDIQATFEEMFKAGIDPRTNPNVDFEKFYKAANLDKIIEAKVNETRQNDLSAKKKRQEQAALPNGGSSVPPSSDEMSDEEVDKILAKMDIRI